MLRATLVLMAALCVTVFCGCASTASESIDPLGAAPDDFSIDAVVRLGRGSDVAREVQLRPGRYIMLADGSLYTGEVIKYPAADQLPGLTRRLSRAQVAVLWSYLKQTGLASPDIGDEVGNANLIEPDPGELVYAVSFTAGGDRWSVLRRTYNEPDELTAGLIRQLARLAWRSDEPEVEMMLAPRRYDFGPDPYARYRRGRPLGQ